MFFSDGPPSSSTARDVFVAQAELGTARQTEQHGQDHRPRAQLTLENAVAVAETALGIRKRDNPVLVRKIALDALDRILRLDAVSADVLDRSGSGAARYQRQVLDAAQSLPDSPADEIVPLGSGSHTDQRPLAIAALKRHAPVERMEQRAAVIGSEKHIVSAAEHIPRLAGGHRSERLPQILRRGELDQPTGRNVEPEAVHPKQRNIFPHFHHTNDKLTH